MATPVNNSAWVEWMTTLMGGVSRQTAAAAFPPDRFYCLLDELPMHLIPQRSRGFLSSDAEQSLFLNPECILTGGGQVPEGVAHALVTGFALQGTIAWVRHRENKWLPFWLGPKFESLVRGLLGGDEVPSSFPKGAASVLAAAGVLVREREDSGNAMEKAAAEFQDKGYAPVANLIHPLHVAALRRYYRHQIRTGAIRLGDDQSRRRYVAHNEPVARFFHDYLASTLSAIAGVRLKPSYVYMASYLSGAELKKHTDREQCEYSITFCLDFSPEPALATPWPIQLDTPRGTVKVYQALGDSLAYRGTRLPHYRAKLNEGQTSTSIFFHYVAEDFSGSLE